MMQVMKRMEVRDGVVDIYLSDETYCFDKFFSDGCKYKYSDFGRKIRSNIIRNNDEIIIEGPFRAGAGILPMINNEFLVLSVRHPNEYVSPYLIQGFGGHIPFGETLFQSASRELSEELALIGIKDNDKADFLYFGNIDSKLYGLASLSFNIENTINLLDFSDIVECDCTMKYNLYKNDRKVETGHALMCFNVLGNSLEVLFLMNTNIDGYKYIVPLHNEIGGEIAMLLHKNIFPYVDTGYFTKALLGIREDVINCILGRKCNGKTLNFV